MAHSFTLATPCAGVVTVYLGSVAYHLTVIGPYIVDDAFSIFARASGHGLVYNPGERAEGYTGLSWVLLLAAAAVLGLP